MFGKSNSANMNVYYTDWKCKQIAVTDDSKNNTFYNAECHFGKPNIIVRTPQSFEPVGTVTYSNGGNRVNANLNGRMLEMKPRSKWTHKDWSYQSTALFNSRGGSNRITWKGSTALVCTDENGMAIARFKLSNWAMKKLGTLEIMNGNLSRQALDEIVVTGLAMMVKINNRQIAGGSASSAGAASSVAAAVSG